MASDYRSALLMAFWGWIKGREDDFDGHNRRNLRSFLTLDSHGIRNSFTEEKNRNNNMPYYHEPSTIRSSFSSDDIGESVDEGRMIESPVTERRSDGLRARTRSLAHEPEEKPLFLHTDDGHTIPLTRLPTCAIFHKNECATSLTSGGGGGNASVPHSFYAFLRQWPALPRVVVRTVLVVSCPADVFARYSSLDGHYQATMSQKKIATM